MKHLDLVFGPSLQLPARTDFSKKQAMAQLTGFLPPWWETLLHSWSASFSETLSQPLWTFGALTLRSEFCLFLK